MEAKKVALLVGALTVAGFTAVTARNMFSAASTPEAAAAPVPVGPEVLVATRPLPIGTILTADSVRFQPWPKELIDKAYYLKGEGADPAKLLGTVVRNPITAGQPVTQGMLVHPGDRGFLAAALGPGMRAVTVSVSGASGVAGFVFPGDRVDLLLTQDVAGGGDGAPLKASETIIRNLRVLATDQRTDNSVDEAGKTQVSTFGTVTIEATPKIVEKIAVAQTIGQLSLALRPLADDTAELERAIASGEVRVPDAKDPRAERQMLLAIAARPIDTDTTFSTGADVSRFQRRSVPGRSLAAASPFGPMPAGGAPAAAAPVAAAVPVGPSVRIARGNAVTLVPVGGK